MGTCGLCTQIEDGQSICFHFTDAGNIIEVDIFSTNRRKVGGINKWEILPKISNI